MGANPHLLFFSKNGFAFFRDNSVEVLASIPICAASDSGGMEFNL